MGKVTEQGNKDISVFTTSEYSLVKQSYACSCTVTQPTFLLNFAAYLATSGRGGRGRVHAAQQCFESDCSTSFGHNLTNGSFTLGTVLFFLHVLSTESQRSAGQQHRCSSDAGDQTKKKLNSVSKITLSILVKKREQRFCNM